MHRTCLLLTQSGHCVPRCQRQAPKKQLIGSLQQNGDAARPELVWQLVEMNDKDWDAWGEAAQDASMGPAQRTASHSGVQGQC